MGASTQTKIDAICIAFIVIIISAIISGIKHNETPAGKPAPVTRQTPSPAPNRSPTP